MEPKFPRGHEFLARARAARSAPIESVRASLDRMVETGADVSHNYSRSFERFSLAMLVGDLPAASAAVRDGERELAGHLDEVVQGQLAQVLSVIAHETGDDAEAERIRADFERRSSAWTKDWPHGLRILRLDDMFRSGKLGRAEYDQKRDTLYREQLSRRSVPTGSMEADWIWLYVYSVPNVYTNTSAMNADALKRIDAHAPLFDEFGELGFTYVPAKRYAQAIPSLRRSTDRCTVMPESVWLFTQSTLFYLWTQVLLGEALEGTGDKAGACTAYGVVMERWKNAKPRSVVLERSRARAKALGCTK